MIWRLDKVLKHLTLCVLSQGLNESSMAAFVWDAVASTRYAAAPAGGTRV